MTRPALAPKCGRCRRRHDPGLRCWNGRYQQRMAALVFQMKGRQCLRGFPGCTSTATTIDHDQARSRWGDDTMSNLLPCCDNCNRVRGNRDVVYPPDRPTIPAGRPISARWRTP